jgi:hypothetical protein
MSAADYIKELALSSKAACQSKRPARQVLRGIWRTSSLLFGMWAEPGASVLRHLAEGSYWSRLPQVGPSPARSILADIGHPPGAPLLA